jgi:hypothetical protein
MQTRHGMSAKEFTNAKSDLRRRLDELRDELDRYLAGEYHVDLNNPKKFSTWRDSHQPFHWFVEFYGIIHNGGFDTIIGNPPYISYSKVRDLYRINEQFFNTISCNNLYAFISERELNLGQGYIGIILPLSSTNANDNSSLQSLLRNLYYLYISHFAVRPSKLFVGVDMNLTIICGAKKGSHISHNTTKFIRWLSSYRDFLFSTIDYISHDIVVKKSAFPKFGNNIEVSIWQKLNSISPKINFSISKYNGKTLAFHSFGRYWRKCIREKLSDNYQKFKILSRYEPFLICLLNSQLAYWYWIVISDCYRFTKTDAFNLPIPNQADHPIYTELSSSLLESYEKNSLIKLKLARNKEHTSEKQFFPAKSKAILDEIDRVLAKHYGLNDKEFDFIINFDIKFRMGCASNDFEDCS